MEQPENQIIYGRKPVMEALESGNAVETVFFCGKPSGSLLPIAGVARANGVVIKEVVKAKLDAMLPDVNHQGVAAVVSPKEYCTVEEILALAEQRQQPPFLVVLDGIEDPHNLGAIIRTAECAGVHGIIIPKRRSAALSGAAVKTSAGALAHMLVARVSNIAEEIRRLQDKNIWVYGADMDGEPYLQTDFSGGAALVIGNEGSGLSSLVAARCDKLVSIPMRGKINSLNASVAAGVLIFKIASGRE
ncbi:MAG: 23S rRNA (guanosine(2251)-2'-O)-methyltransferase RlmB [Oscillospiraceae bacterium]|nr:23S rRNA (guanosine(2251)-2'-O)-methyltransferase RlmB [Oscillospiraceae bacterium]